MLVMWILDLALSFCKVKPYILAIMLHFEIDKDV